MSEPKPERTIRWDSLLRTTVWGGACGLWLLPLIASQFTAEINWTVMDYIVWGIMLLIAASMVELALRMSGSMVYRLGVSVAVGTAFLLVWANLAVGFIGNENNPLNQMFAGVLAVAVVGAVISRGRSIGMARAMAATAIAQFVVAAVAQYHGHFIWVATAAFAALWLGAAALFQKAARTGS